MPDHRHAEHELALVDVLELEAELECLHLDHLAGLTPPGMRRALFDHELDGAVNFAKLQTTVDERAQVISRRLADDRAKFAQLLHDDLANAIRTSTGAADLAISGRLNDLLDPSRYADPIAGTVDLVNEAERFHSAELAHSAQEGIARAVAEARAQGIPAGQIAGVADVAQARLDALARRLAAQPHADVVTAARHAADQVAGLGLAGEHVLGQVDAAVADLSTGPLDNYARPAAQQAHNLGHQEAAAAAPGHVTIYASELLDSNTCGPCSLIDGHEYATEEEALADYPGGTYVDCEGGDRCRGTLVYVWETEAPATVGPPPDTGPDYPLGTSRKVPQGPSSPAAPAHPIPVAPDHVAPAPPAPPVEATPVAPAPVEPPTPPVPEPDLVELPDVPVEAEEVTADELAAGRRNLAGARQEVRDAAKAARDEVMATLDRADALHIKAPPKAKAVRNPATGRIEYRRETQGYDWFDSLGEAEKSRLRRFWLSDPEAGISPDELAAHWSARFGREVTSDEAAAEWLDLTRRADATSTLSRGRIINSEPYGGMDVNQLVDSPYDLHRLFAGDKEEAARHLAGVDKELAGQVADVALPITTRLGPQAYEMQLDEFVAEVVRLEEAQAAIVPLSEDEFGVVLSREDQAVEDRLAELIPHGIEDPANPLGLDELHELIKTIARRAGRL